MPATLVVHRAQQMVARLVRITVRVDGTERAALKVGETATVVLEPGPHTLQIALDGGAAPEHGFDVGDREDEFALHASVAMGSTGNEVRLASSTGEPWPPVAATPPPAAPVAAPPPAAPADGAPADAAVPPTPHAPTAGGVPRQPADPTVAPEAPVYDAVPDAAHAPIEAVAAAAVPVMAMRAHRGGLILGLGLVALIVLPMLFRVFLGMIAGGIVTPILGGSVAAMGFHDLSLMKRGAVDPRGRTLTIVGVVVAVLAVLSSAVPFVFFMLF